MHIDTHYSVNNLTWDVSTSWTGKYIFTKYSLVKEFPKWDWDTTDSIEELNKEHQVFLNIAQTYSFSPFHMPVFYFPEVDFF